MTEDRFTRESSFCLHPEYWHSPDSEGTETEVSNFIASLIEMIKPDFVLETGTWYGYTTSLISSALQENGHGRLVSIEKDRLVYEEAMRHYYWPNTTILNMNTMDYIPDQDIDFAFFDSWQEGRHLEFKRFYDMGRLKEGAIVAFHDTAPHHQVRKHIESLYWWAGDSPPYINIIDFHTPRGLILGQVR